MRRQAIEADELFEVANRLLADGKEVTALTLLDALGGGSLRTIYKHLEVWKTRRPAVVVTSGNDEIPDNVRSVFASAWRTARQEAGLEVLAVREKAAEEVKEALQQFHGALEAIEKLEKESEYDAVEIEAFKITLAGRNAEITRLEAENAAEKAAAQELRGQIESQKEELARLHKELDQSRGERDSAMKEAAELKGVADTLKTQNEQLMARWNVQDEKRK